MKNREVYCGFNQEDFNRVRDMLDDNRIKHTHKIVDLTTPSCLMDMRGIRTVSRANTAAANAMRQYYVYVSDSDYEKAEVILKKGI